MVMAELAADLRAEGDEFNTLLTALSQEDWQRPTPFKNWTAEDVVQHLLVGDWLNHLTLTNAERFQQVMKQRQADRARGVRSLGGEYLDFGLGDGQDLRQQWYDGLNRLCDLFAQQDPKTRMQWVGPDMSVRSAATARLMETWAHAQDVYDLLKRPRQATDRLRHIAVLGVNTFNWSFQNRGQTPPGSPPYVRLTAPSGAVWEWHAPTDEEAGDDDEIRGSALDFCQVVTQGRHVSETNLHVHGPVATAWMAIAQCFAGPPEDPPQPGVRGWQ